MEEVHVIPPSEGREMIVEYLSSTVQHVEEEDPEISSHFPRATKECVSSYLEGDENTSQQGETNVATGGERDSAEKAIWLEPPTKLLISLYKECKPKVGKTNALKNKRRMWDYLKDKMQKHGYKFTAVQIESKWKSLQRSYKTATGHNNKTKRKRANFEKELTEILKDNDDISPQFTLNSSGEKHSRTNMDLMGSYENAGTSIGSNNNTNNNVNKKRTIVDEMIKIRKQKEEHFEKRLTSKRKEREEEQHYRREVLKAYKERTKAIERRNNLLKLYLNNFGKRN